MSKVAVRCSYAAALLTFVLLGFSLSAQAQTSGHGIGIQKECDSPVRRCSTANQDDVCPDTDACTPRECDLEIQENLICRFTVIYNDSYGDTISLIGAWDQIDPFGLNIRSPAAGNAEIIEVGGNTNCTVGGSLGCFIGPDDGAGSGFVVFQDDTFVPSQYFPAPGLPSPLVDQVASHVYDNCESGDAGCNPSGGFATFTAQTNLVDGCRDGEPPDCNDDNVCTTDTCDPIDGCVNTPGALGDCDDGDACTEDTCDAIDGCVNTPYPPETSPPGCFSEVAICRTPGFWGSHAGASKNRSINITQQVMDSVGGLWVCGMTIDNTIATEVGDPNSALEAMCTFPKGVQERQLVRQLTAAALNCVMSGGDGACVGGPIEDLYTACNATCVGDPSPYTVNECIGLIDCFNNGGTVSGGQCVYNPGVCEGSNAGDLCDVDAPDCGDLAGDVCVPDPLPTCHERELCQLNEDGEFHEDGLCFIPPGPAGSQKECNVARKNGLYLPY